MLSAINLSARGHLASSPGYVLLPYFTESGYFIQINLLTASFDHTRFLIFY